METQWTTTQGSIQQNWDNQRRSITQHWFLLEHINTQLHPHADDLQPTIMSGRSITNHCALTVTPQQLLPSGSSALTSDLKPNPQWNQLYLEPHQSLNSCCLFWPWYPLPSQISVWRRIWRWLIDFTTYSSYRTSAKTTWTAAVTSPWRICSTPPPP